jgi:hypothetical protein
MILCIILNGIWDTLFGYLLTFKLSILLKTYEGEKLTFEFFPTFVSKNQLSKNNSPYI